MNKFVIVIAVRNANVKNSTIQIGEPDPNFQLPISYIERALKSTHQNYPHYRIIILDDASTDGTWDKIVEYLPYFEVPVVAIRNPERMWGLANHYRIAQDIEDDEIIVVLDGDDQLNGPGVLTKLDEVYSDPDVWMTYGSFNYDECSRQFQPPGTDPRGFAWQMGGYNRTFPFSCTHLRTYKRWLFDRIRIEDLKYNDKFYQCICDLVTMYPMLEMAGPDHSRYIYDILYLYNDVNPYNERKGPGAWPTKTDAQKAIKAIGELELGHSKILVTDEVDEMAAHFCGLPIYPRLPYPKSYPSDLQKDK